MTGVEVQGNKCDFCMSCAAKCISKTTAMFINAYQHTTLAIFVVCILCIEYPDDLLHLRKCAVYNRAHCMKYCIPQCSELDLTFRI